MTDKITIDRSVSQQALEWLNANAEHDQRCDLIDLDDDGLHKPCSCGLNAVTRNLREAQQMSEPVTKAVQSVKEPEFDDCRSSPSGKHSKSWVANNDCEYCKTGAQPDAPLYYASPEEPASLQPAEPVAWIAEGEGPMLFFDREEGLCYCEEDEQPTPLYTHPQPAAANLQPLTNEQIADLWSSEPAGIRRPILGFRKVLAFARAIEAAHGITGGSK